MASSEFQEYVSSATKWAYWIIGLVIVFGVSNYLYNKMNKQIAALLVFMAGILALYYYYVKWFMVNALSWPPVVSLCPDFLTAIGPDSDGTVYCVDMTSSGASSNGRFQISTQLPSLDRAKSLATSSVGANTAQVLKITTAQMKTDANTLCDTILPGFGLTWHTFCEARI